MEKLETEGAPQNTGGDSSQVSTVCTVAYIFFIGWILAYVMWNDKNKANKNSLTNFHIRQALGVNITIIACYIIANFIQLVPFIGGVLSILLFILPLVLLIMGIMAGSSKEEKLLPVVGPLFQDTFKGIK